MKVSELIVQCQKGDPKAQRLLFDHFINEALGVANRYLRDTDLSRECVITGFGKVFQNMVKQHFHNEKAFKGWVMKIIVNECLQLIRKRKNISFMESLEDQEMTLVQPIENEIEEMHIQAALDILPTGYRLIFSMYAIEGYSHKEISQELGISESTSRSQLVYARKKLMKILNMKA